MSCGKCRLSSVTFVAVGGCGLTVSVVVGDLNAQRGDAQDRQSDEADGQQRRRAAYDEDRDAVPVAPREVFARAPHPIAQPTAALAATTTVARENWMRIATRAGPREVRRR